MMKELTVFTNGGSQNFELIGNFRHLPMEVHYNKDSLANIHSLKHVTDLPGVSVSMNTIKDPNIFVHLPNGNVIKFQQYSSGLYYHDVYDGIMTSEPMTRETKTSEEEISTNNINDEVIVYPTTLLNTVAENCKFYTRKEIEGAKKARKLQQVLGWPGTSTFKSYLNNNLITNSEVTADDVSRAEHIFGVPIPLLRGKMTNTPTPHSTATIKKKKLPLSVPLQHQCITLFVDFFYVNKLPFLQTK